LAITCEDNEKRQQATECALALGVELVKSPGDQKYVLEFGPEVVRLLNRETKSQSKIEVDFLSGKAEHRRRFGGGKGQLIAKAVGVTSKFKPMVFDATAGLGQDGFVLACLGCKVDMMERSPVAYALLYDGLSRAKSEPGKDQEVEAIFARLNLLQGDSIEYLKKAKFPVSDIIYLDPMFPSRQKKAAVKKEMQAFHALVGKDSDELELLDVALSKAKFRVVVKRPRLASPIGNRSPSFKCEGKSSRYDVYCLKALGQNDQEG